jgi:mono/diheme cytochrome c family protein
MKRLVLVLLAAWAVTPALAETEFEEIMHGKGLVETNCAQCHGVSLKDKSKHDKAPVFRSLAKRYPIEALEEAFAEGIYSGHPDMPVFEATPEQVSAIVAYINSIQDQ